MLSRAPYGDPTAKYTPQQNQSLSVAVAVQSPSSQPSTAANTESLRETMFEPERIGFSFAGEFVSRSGLARSAGHPRMLFARAKRSGSPFLWSLSFGETKESDLPWVNHPQVCLIHRLAARQRERQKPQISTGARNRARQPISPPAPPRLPEKPSTNAPADYPHVTPRTASHSPLPDHRAAATDQAMS